MRWACACVAHGRDGSTLTAANRRRASNKGVNSSSSGAAHTTATVAAGAGAAGGEGGAAGGEGEGKAANGEAAAGGGGGGGKGAGSVASERAKRVPSAAQLGPLAQDIVQTVPLQNARAKVRGGLSRLLGALCFVAGLLGMRSPACCARSRRGLGSLCHVPLQQDLSQLTEAELEKVRTAVVIKTYTAIIR